MKYFISIILFIIFSGGLQARELAISGRITSKGGGPVPFANVVLLEQQLAVSADKNGEFIFEGILPGVYTLKVYLDGYQSRTLKIETDKDEKIDIVLEQSSLQASPIMVTARSGMSETLTSPQSVTVVEGRLLDRKRGQTVTALIQGTPGVSAVNTGAGISKPVIRGLSGQRILVLTDGVRQEDQQFGDEHGLNIDSFGVKKVEVIKGPASLLYGSDALGGVINIIRLKAPDSREQAGKLESNVYYNSQSVNRSDAGGIDVYGKTNQTGYRVMTSRRKAGRLQTPDGRLPNTGFTEENKSASMGNSGKWGSVYVDAFERVQIQDIYKNPNEFQGEMQPTPQQFTRHDKTHVNSVINFSAGRLETDLGYQRNHRREKENKDPFVNDLNFYQDPDIGINEKLALASLGTVYRDKKGLNLNLDTGTADVRFHHNEISRVKGTFGVSGTQQRNRTIGTEPLIPSYAMNNVAAYIYEEYRIGNLVLSGGLRSDKRLLDIKNNEDIGNGDETKIYYANSGSAGTVLRTGKNTAIALNYSSGFRTPTPFELYSNGIHEGSGRFERGETSLNPERSRSVDLSFRYISGKMKSELNFFKNTIDNYIYATPAGETDPESRLPVYQYKQDRAIVRGGEFDVEREITNWLILQAGFDIVRGRNDHTGHWLPMMPADNGRMGIRLVKNRLLSLYRPYFEVTGRFYSKQTRLDPDETPTGSYNLVDLGLGWEIESIGKNAMFDLSVTNLMNQKYYSHLNRYKFYALDPGININFKVTVPLSLLE